MENIFKNQWLTIEDIVTIITDEKSITNFLEDIKQDYRIQRAMWEDEWDKLLNWTRVIDDIIWRISKLEEARKEYFTKQKEIEVDSIKKQINS
jgi:hypothetical protein